MLALFSLQATAVDRCVMLINHSNTPDEAIQTGAGARKSFPNVSKVRKISFNNGFISGVRLCDTCHACSEFAISTIAWVKKKDFAAAA